MNILARFAGIRHVSREGVRPIRSLRLGLQFSEEFRFFTLRIDKYFDRNTCVLSYKDREENFLSSWKRIKIVYPFFWSLNNEMETLGFPCTNKGWGNERILSILWIIGNFKSSSRARIFTDAFIKRMDETAGLSFIVSSAIYFFSTLVYTELLFGALFEQRELFHPYTTVQIVKSFEHSAKCGSRSYCFLSIKSSRRRDLCTENDARMIVCIFFFFFLLVEIDFCNIIMSR